MLNLVDVASGKVVTDHLWFTLGARFDRLCFVRGDVVRFDARVAKYLKGYVRDHEFDCREVDFRLIFPSKVRVVGRIPQGQTLLCFE
jgi:hypothetical protein